MIKTTYYCNLCGDERKKDELYKFYFDSARMPQQFVLLKMAAIPETDRHICKSCVDVIVNTPKEELI